MQVVINAVLISLSIANIVGLLYISRVDRQVIKAVSNFDVRLKTLEKLMTDKDIVSMKEVADTIKIIEADRDNYLNKS